MAMLDRKFGKKESNATALGESHVFSFLLVEHGKHVITGP
jgi:hypothetical protein